MCIKHLIKAVLFRGLKQGSYEFTLGIMNLYLWTTLDNSPEMKLNKNPQRIHTISPNPRWPINLSLVAKEKPTKYCLNKWLTTCFVTL